MNDFDRLGRGVIMGANGYCLPARRSFDGWTSDNRGRRLIRDSTATRAAWLGDSHHRRFIDDPFCWTFRRR